MVCVYVMINIQSWEFMSNILITFQMNKAFWKVIMQIDVTGEVIII